MCAQGPYSWLDRTAISGNPAFDSLSRLNPIAAKPRGRNTPSTKFFVDTTKGFVYAALVSRKSLPPPPPKPTAAELAILNVLWRLGSATVRDVHSELQSPEPMAYTTTLKLMQIMADKGLVTREESARAHVYRPARKQEETQRQMVNDLLQRAFGGSSQQLVLRALSAQPASAQEIQEIRNMLDALEQKREREGNS